MDDRSWEIYTLADPRSLSVRYVGVSIDAHRRFMGHLDSAKRGTKTHCARWVRSLIAQGLTPILSVIERGAGQSRIAAEQQWIALYRSTSSLTNLTDGGEGKLGYRCSPKTRAKMSAAREGHKCSPETLAKMSAAAQNMSLEHRAKIGAAKKGRPWSMARRRAQNNTAEKWKIEGGRKCSPETRAKLSTALKGHRCSPETRVKLSVAAKRYYYRHHHDVLVEET